MKSLILYSVLFFVVCAEEGNELRGEDSKGSVKEVIQINPMSKLNFILDEMDLNKKTLSSKDLLELATINKDFLYCDTCNLENFYSLKDLYYLFSINNEEGEFDEFLLENFKLLRPLKSKPTNWGQTMVKASGGALGLTTDYLLRKGNHEVLDNMITHIIEVGDVEKMKVLWRRAKLLKNPDEFKKNIVSRISKTNSKFPEVLLDELAK